MEGYTRETMPVLSCRFYKQRFPELEDVVVVNVKSIAEMGAYVTLLEYNNAEGMILLSELSRRRIRSINKLVRVGRNEYVVVIRVDTDKGEALECVTYCYSDTALFDFRMCGHGLLYRAILVNTLRH